MLEKFWKAHLQLKLLVTKMSGVTTWMMGPGQEKIVAKKIKKILKSHKI